MRRYRLIGWLGTCPTPYCGSIYGYFCVKCHHYTSECACHYNYGGCECDSKHYWASTGERASIRALLEADMLASN